MSQSFVNVHDIAGECCSPREHYMQCPDCKRLIRVTVGCGKRFDYFCPACAARWRRRTFAKYYRGVLAMSRPSFLTLTLRKNVGRVTERLMSIWSMKKLLFKELARMGYKIPRWVGVIEPPNHIHLVIDAKYIPRAVIKNIWSRITGDSYIIDIRRIAKNDFRSIAAYITKYLSKASDWTGVNLDLLKGFHLIGSWGCPPPPPKKSLCLCGCMHVNVISAEGYHVLLQWQDRYLPQTLAAISERVESSYTPAVYPGL